MKCKYKKCVYNFNEQCMKDKPSGVYTRIIKENNTKFPCGEQ